MYADVCYIDVRRYVDIYSPFITSNFVQRRAQFIYMHNTFGASQCANAARIASINGDTLL
jgi:hypothetical protein